MTNDETRIPNQIRMTKSELVIRASSLIRIRGTRLRVVVIRICVFAIALPAAAATKITFDPSGTMRIDDKPTFVISFTMAPQPDAKTPDGRNAYDELREAGGNYLRVPPP